MIDDVFRGVTKDADYLIERAIELNASDKQREFMRGIQDFFQQDYEEAIMHFDNLLEIDPEHIPAKSLRAVAVLNQGDEWGYYLDIKQIKPNDVRTFEDNFFLGFANTLDDSVLRNFSISSPV